MLEYTLLFLSTIDASNVGVEQSDLFKCRELVEWGGLFSVVFSLLSASFHWSLLLILLS